MTFNNNHITIYNIPDHHRFFDIVLTCKGGVRFLNRWGEVGDLKAVIRILRESGMDTHMEGIDKIDVYVEQTGDTLRLFHFMAGMAYPVCDA